MKAVLKELAEEHGGDLEVESSGSLREFINDSKGRPSLVISSSEELKVFDLSKF